MLVNLTIRTSKSKCSAEPFSLKGQISIREQGGNEITRIRALSVPGFRKKIIAVNSLKGINLADDYVRQ